MFKKLIFLFKVAIIILVVSFTFNIFPQKKPNSCCIYWQAKIDQSLGYSKLTEDVEELQEKEIYTAIDCLLKLEGNKNKARFSGAMKDYVSSVPEFTPVEVSSLYYISYLYYKKFDHADLVALVDNSGDFNSQYSIQEAYQSYRKWFEKVKEIGLEEARKQKLDPLEGSGVRWY